MGPDGEHLLLTLKSPWRDGTSKIILTPFELLERLAALRDEVVASKEVSDTQKADHKIRRPGFAKLMARVFEIDVLECPRCKSRMQLISFITDPAVNIAKNDYCATKTSAAFRKLRFLRN